MCFNTRNSGNCGGNSSVFVIRNNNRCGCGWNNGCNWSGWNNCNRCGWSGWNSCNRCNWNRCGCDWSGWNNCNRCGWSGWNNGCEFTTMPVSNDVFVNRYTGCAFSNCNGGFGNC